MPRETLADYTLSRWRLFGAEGVALVPEEAEGAVEGAVEGQVEGAVEGAVEEAEVAETTAAVAGLAAR